MKIIFIFFPFFLLAANGVSQTCGIVDMTFGIGGKAIGHSTNGNTGLPASCNVLLQSDNKIIQVARLYNNSFGFSLVRYTINGVIDSSFGINGKVITSMGTGESFVNAGIIQADGKIVLAGYAYNGNNWDFAMARYNNNGSLDNSFGTGGKQLTQMGSYDDFANGLTIQPDGKIVVVGSSYDNNYISSYAILRYKSNGIVDSSFGQNGKIISHFGPLITYIGNVYYGTYSHEYGTAVAIQTDGKIVVGGQSYIPVNCFDYYGGLYCNPIFTMVRYQSSGKLDSTFGKNGKVSDSVSLLYMSSMILQPDGKIVVTGTGNPNGFFTERYNNNGALDNSFGSAGITFTQISSSTNGSQPSSVAIQPDGKIVVGGSTYTNNGSDIAIVRYNTNGILDNTFNGNGTAVLHLGQPGSSEGGTGVAMQGSKILVSFYNFLYINNNNYSGSIGVVRLLDDLSPSVFPVITARGPVTFCQGGNVKLSSNLSGTIQWYKSGVLISGATDTTYTATSSGSYAVMVNNSNGCGVSLPVNVTVNNNPPKPPITWTTTYIFNTTAGYPQYQWLLNGVVIAGNNASVYKPLQSGIYKVTVTDINGCSNTSDSFNLVALAVSDIIVGNTKLRYYPNPAQTFLNIDVSNPYYSRIIAELYDASGRLIQKKTLNQTNNQLPVDHLPMGLYKLVIHNGREKIAVKVMITE